MGLLSYVNGEKLFMCLEEEDPKEIDQFQDHQGKKYSLHRIDIQDRTIIYQEIIPISERAKRGTLYS